MADIKIAGRIKAGAADGIAGYASEILFDDAASNKTVKEKISDKADKSEMSVVAGTGADADKTTITLKSGTSATVLTQHQDVSKFIMEGEVFGSGGDSAASFNSYADTVWNKQQTLSESQKQQVRENIGIADLETIRSGAAAGATAVQPAAMNTALAAKQDTLTFDNAPTANSNNPVTSGGVKSYVDNNSIGFNTVTSLQDGTVEIRLSNGDTVTIDLNHNHPQYLKYVLCETLADYNAISTKDATTLYLIPSEAVYLGDVLIVQSGSPLPYTPVDYIQTDGTAYIDTGIKGNVPKSSEMKLIPLSEGAFTTHLGARNGNNRFLLVCQWGNAGGYTYDNNIAYGYATGANQGMSMAATLSNHTPIIVRTALQNETEYFGIKQSGDSAFTAITETRNVSVTTNYNIYIFASNHDGAVAQHASSGVKVYYCKIFSDTNFTTPVFDGVPCVYNGEYGLWDKVTNTFFGNAAGSGAFTGPQI